MFEVKIDREGSVLLHEQVAAQIRRAIADGEAKPGERLPPARHLAAVMHSTPTPCSVLCDYCGTRAFWSFDKDLGSE